MPFGHWKAMTFIGALRHDRMVAPWVLDGPVNADVLQAYVETQLDPTLAKGDVVVMTISARTSARPSAPRSARPGPS